MAGKNTAVFGIYPTRASAEDAVDALRTAGFRSTDVSVLFSENQGTKDFAHAKATKHLEDLAVRLGKDGANASIDVRVGVPANEILDAITTHGAQLVVMGTHGHTGIRHLIAGSVTEKIVRSATVPVLTIRHPD